jgi:hypothetical protein
VDISIKPEEIDKYVKDAILKSSIGKVIQDSSEKYMNEILSQHWDSPIKKILYSVVRDLMEAKIKEPHNLKIIEDAFHKEFTDKIVAECIYKIISKLETHIS